MTPGGRAMRPGAAVLAALVVCAGGAAAQVTIGASVTPVFTRATVPGDSSLSEFRLTAPLVFATAEALTGHLSIHAMLNGEGATMPGGQLGLGVWGEGWSDRRHPHTWAHELIVTLRDPVALPGALHLSVSAGKGFAPFGTDDPMNRPALGYPVNHHWAQVLERAVLVVGLARGPVVLEAGLFNGDEPENYSQWPNWSRFGDSWSARALVHPSAALELQASYAHIKSPEHRPGAGPEHEKASLSARLERPLGAGTLYASGEWAYNSEVAGFFRYYSALVETQYSSGGRRAYLRLERTDRPEEQRIFGDPFRSIRPHFENSNIGITRWTVATAGAALVLTPRAFPVGTEAVVEAARARVSALTGLFDPAAFYGRNDLWLASVALRITAGAPVHRMGRYGVAGGPAHHHHPDRDP